LQQRFRFGLIFSLITLLVQLIAPVSATYAMANASLRGGIPICVHTNNDNGNSSPADHDKSCPCCTLMCSVAHAAFPTPSDIPSAIVTPRRMPQKLVFKVTSFIPAARPFLPLAQPRAPPAA